MKILVINGPNMNFLGIRSIKDYGVNTYDDLLSFISEKARKLNAEVEFFQSNSEGEIIDRLQKAYYENIRGLIINPAAYTHYSYAIRDCLEYLPFRKIEVHITDIYTRENFRKISVISEVCNKTIAGYGFDSYIMALEDIIQNEKK